jgi:hypothetical protein
MQHGHAQIEINSLKIFINVENSAGFGTFPGENILIITGIDAAIRIVDIVIYAPPIESQMYTDPRAQGEPGGRCGIIDISEKIQYGIRRERMDTRTYGIDKLVKNFIGAIVFFRAAVGITFEILLVKFTASRTFAPSESVIGIECQITEFRMFLLIIKQIFDQFLPQSRVGGT